MFAGAHAPQLRILLVSGLIAIASVESFSREAAAQSAQSSNSAKAQIIASYGNLPLSFVANAGQTDKSVKFISKGSGYGLYLTSDEAVLALSRRSCDGGQASIVKRSGDDRGQTGCANDTAVVTMRLAGRQSRNANPAGEEQLPGTANYFAGSDRANWRTGVPTYAKVRYSEVYPGVDLLYYGNQRQLEYDFAVAPHADPNLIRLQFSGVTKLKVDSDGDLIVSAKDGDFAFRKPVIYQEKDGRRDWIAGRFTLGKRHTVGFLINAYDHSQTLVIDPVLAYSTYLGGSGSDGDEALAIAVDSSGDAYVTGQTDSTNFPLTSGANQQTDADGTGLNAFVTKLNPTGTALVYSTYLGGSGNTQATALAVDSSGDAYVTGHTFATNFPTTAGAFKTASTANSSGYTAFITKLNPAGTALVYSTYLGGSGNGAGTGETTYGLALDSADDVYVVGYTDSANFPTTSGAFQATNPTVSSGASSAFVTKLNPAGSALVFSSFLGGNGQNDGGDIAYAVALDSANDVYVAGSTGSTNFPTTTGAYLTANPACANSQTAAFVTKLNSSGTALVYSTYLGGSKDSGAYALAVNASGNAYVAGDAMYTDFPVTSGAYQTTNNAAALSTTNAFVAELNTTGTGLVYSTWLGGSGMAINSAIHSGDSADGLALDASGDAYVTGTASSSNFPVTGGAAQSTNDGAANKASNAFVTELNPTGTALVYSTYLGGSGYPFGDGEYYRGDDATGLALDSSGNIYVAGSAFSTNFPVTNGAFQSSNLAAGSSGSNAFVSKVSMGSLISTTTALSSSANPGASGESVTFTADVAASSGSATPTGSVVFTVDGNTVGTEALNSNGAATYSTSTLAAGSHTISANYGGSSAFSASTSSSLAQTISAATASAPAFSPAVGTYTSAQSVTLSSATPGTTIYYTTNGNTPTTSSTKYSSAISVNATETIQAIAVASGYGKSQVASGAYTINLAAAATPTFSVAAGTYTSAQSVTLADATAGATIYYTTNGVTPTTSSTEYSGAISVSATETIQAVAVASGYSTSTTASAKYIIMAATPTFSLAAGNYTGTQSVTISDSATGATIYYTTNGTTPTTSSTKYAGSISVAESETIEALAVVKGVSNSAVASAEYTITAPTPTFSVAAGTYTAIQAVTLSDATSGATIYYTTNGAKPTTSSTQYTGAISVTESETIKAIAVVSGDSNSAVASAEYKIHLPAEATR